MPAGYPPDLDGMVAPSVDYISPATVPLTKKEKQALRLSADWSRRNVAPVLGEGGKVIYVHGAAMPTILAAPMQVCDVELEKGETVNEIVVGDSARWLVETGTAGAGSGAIVHLFIKPVDAGLESSAVVTTDRRVYHLRLVSQRSGHTPYVGFVYADNLRRSAAVRKAEDSKQATWKSTTIDGERRDLSDLNFAYSVNGNASWKPERVYDDGQKMFIRLPENTGSGEMPVLLVRKGNKDILVNYRVKDAAIVVDGIFAKLSLIVGVGKEQEKVEVIRQGGMI
ncbi:MAG: P-type conjugative transfer protein TrbG [Desulfovibrionaceae bacterium]|nr:P-type conjugative transfer protein TrbG [Desulfovibrionaceae bacterium]